jgi:hypothetical protein
VSVKNSAQIIYLCLLILELNEHALLLLDDVRMEVSLVD